MKRAERSSVLGSESLSLFFSEEPRAAIGGFQLRSDLLRFVFEVTTLGRVRWLVGVNHKP